MASRTGLAPKLCCVEKDKISMAFRSGWSWKTDTDRQKRQGDIVHQDTGHPGYFKSLDAANKGEPPHPAMELVAYLLASELQLPIPKYEPMELDSGDKGLGSVLLPPPFAEWRLLPDGATVNDFEDPALFPRLLAFDVFTGNTDRHKHNLMYRELEKGHWEAYLIDHTHIFDGGEWIKSPQNPPRYRNDQNTEVETFIRSDNDKLEEFYEETVSSWSDVEPHVGDIQALTDGQIGANVDRIPSEFADPDQFDRIVEVLEWRRDELEGMFRDFVGGGSP